MDFLNFDVMQSTWTVRATPPGHGVDAAAFDALLDVPCSNAPASGMLEFVNAFAKIDYLSLVEYTGAVPSQIDGCSHRAVLPNITGECFARYKRHFSHLDEITRLAEHVQREPQATADVVAVHYGLADIPDSGWRQDIFEHSRLSGRLSLLYAPLAHTAFVINLYRDESLGGFTPGEIERVLVAAPILRKVHLTSLRTRRETLAPEVRLELMLGALALRGPQLSRRERDVCARIANGLSVDGIAADMGVAPSTVQTLRKRAYAKLGIHGRQQLSSLIS
jgi:DNA-binding CsgD family transcriptional regulator